MLSETAFGERVPLSSTMLQQLGTSSLLHSREVSDPCPTDDVTAAEEKLKAAATELRAAQQRRVQTTDRGGVKVRVWRRFASG